MQEELLSLLDKLVSVESIKSKPDKLNEVVAVVENYFKDTGLVMNKYEHNGKPSIVILNQNTKHPHFLLNGHLDVIEAEPDQFKMKIEGDIVRGRGVFDMKGYVAVMMVALKQAIKEIPHLSSVGLMLTTDEEIGGVNGVKYLVNNEKYGGDLAYVPDGGEEYRVVIEEKGVFHCRLKATGKAAHGARPWQGDNALDKLIRVYNKIRADFPNPTHHEDWRISCNLGQISGGDAPNKVPDTAEMLLDFRFIYPETVNSMTDKIKSYLGNESIELEVISTGEVARINTEAPEFQKFIDVLKQKTKKPEIIFERACGASDSRYFENTPILMTRGSGGGQHGKDEWANFNDIVTSAEMLKELILYYCKAKI